MKKLTCQLFLYYLIDQQVGVVDFQWTGHGRPSVDLAYFVCAGISPEVANKDLENIDSENDLTTSLMSYYHAAFKEFWVKIWGLDIPLPPSMETVDDLLKDYGEAFADLMRTAITDHYGAKFERTTLEKRMSLPDDKKLCFNAYNKSVDVGVWTMLMLHRFLSDMQ